MKTAILKILFLSALLSSNIDCGQGQVDDDIVIKYENKNTSFLELARQLNIRFGSNFLKGCELQSSRSCKGRCGKWERNETPKCYCDDLCQELGDCCHDYYTRCNKSLVKPKPSMHSCFDLKISFKKELGLVIVSKCPAYLNRSSQLVRACEHPDPSDAFQLLPVLDRKTNINYMNYFCARCNQATNITFWQARRGCDDVLIQGDFNLNSFMQRFCNKPIYSWTFSPPTNAIVHYCTLTKHNGWCKEANSNKQVNWEIVRSLCEAYYLPVCQQQSQFPYNGKLYNNPHCLLCGVRFYVDSHCFECPSDPVVIGPPGLQIAFDFSSTSEIKVTAGGRTIVMIPERCNESQVYDPFSRSCRDLAPVPEAMTARKMYIDNFVSNTTLTNFTSNATLVSNCVRVPFTNEEVKLFPNGSVYIKPHNRVYPKNVYISSGIGIILCTNFSQNFTKNDGVFKNGKENIHSLALRLITYVGGALSILSLIILIALYVRIKEIKKLPGKIVMSLACSLLGFQMVFFLTGITGRPVLCSAVAVVLHYLLLASFTWMNVLAVDMAFTFASLESGVAVPPAHDEKNRKFLKYCCHGWITPMISVGICVSLEWSNTVSIGYGSAVLTGLTGAFGLTLSNAIRAFPRSSAYRTKPKPLYESLMSCWISNGKALLYVVCVPVAVALTFNLAALVLSVVAIKRTRQNARKISKGSKPLDLSLLSLKLTVIFGLTWALGFAAAFEETAFIWYPFVILNSLQGALLFIALKTHTKIHRLFRGPESDKSTKGRQFYTKVLKPEKPLQLNHLTEDTIVENC